LISEFTTIIISKLKSVLAFLKKKKKEEEKEEEEKEEKRVISK
jgi:hypothetical protein